MRTWVIAAVVLSFCCLEKAACGAVAERPNILLIITDDQGYGDAGSYGSTDLRTPHFDALCAAGARFTRFRVNPLCAPTRASVLSGQYSLETGMWRGPSRQEENARQLKSELRLLPQLLKDAGYATGLFGKWHLGYEPPNTPNSRGFDEFVGFLDGAHPYEVGRNARIERNGEPMASAKHTTDLFADEAIEFITGHAQQPFFCYVAFNAVHGPLRNAERDADSGKPEWLAKYSEWGVAQPRRDYCAVMSHADERIGDLLATLDELELARRTLVICFSDNGGLLEKYPGNNGPLRGEKGTTYEGGIRVPAAIRWTGVIPPGTTSHADAAHFDIFATALDAAGIDIPERNGQFPVHGVSLLEHLSSAGKTPLPDRTLFWDLFGQLAAVHGDWKIVAQIANHHGKFDAALEVIKNTQFELYNLAQDIGEQRDLAQSHPNICLDLKQRYERWFEEATR